MARALPPLDHVARALVALGRRDASLAFLEAVVARDDEERVRCEPLLVALRARPGQPVGAPPVAIDSSLVRDLASVGRLAEARVVAGSFDGATSALGLELFQALETVLAPVPQDVPRAIVLRFEQARDRAALALGESVAAADAIATASETPPSLRQRAALLGRLLRGFSLASASIDPLVRAAVRDLAQHRELARARAEVAALGAISGAPEVLLRLDRLLRAVESLEREDAPATGRTTPLHGRGIALLQVRMGNLSEAERLFRQLLLDGVRDADVNELLQDLIALRQVRSDSLHPDAKGAEPKSAAPEWLNKRARKPSVEGWVASPRRPTPAEHDDEISTAIIRPDDEAELHLRAGRPDKAIAIYERLAARHPDTPRFRERAARIRADMDARALEFADEMTVRRDLSGFARSASLQPDGPSATFAVTLPAPAPSNPTPASVVLDHGLPELGAEPTVLRAAALPPAWTDGEPTRNLGPAAERRHAATATTDAPRAVHEAAAAIAEGGLDTVDEEETDPGRPGLFAESSVAVRPILVIV